MIDYEKLKIADLLARSSNNYWFRVSFGAYENCENQTQSIAIYDANHNDVGICITEDELIARLTELTQSKPKYEVGQEVWLLDCDRICTAEIVSHQDGEYKIKNCLPLDENMATGKDWAHENELHSSKQSLIEAQIEYWTNLREPQIIAGQQGEKGPINIYAACPEPRSPFEGEIKGFNIKKPDYPTCQSTSKECQHESDKLYKYSEYCANPPVFECKKCGEFYR